MRANMLIMVLMLSVVTFVEGRGTPGRHLQHFEDGTKYENSQLVEYRTRRPFSYLRNEVSCVKYTVEAIDENTKPFPLLSYAQTEDQMAEFLDSRSLDFIAGSSCNETKCSREFLVPENNEGKRPFYVVLVNGRSDNPAFRPGSQNSLTAEVVVEGCDGDHHGSKGSGANTSALAIVLPIVGVIIICVICAAFTYKNRQKFASEDDRFTSVSGQGVPLAYPESGSQAMSGGSPQVHTVEEPVPGSSYSPPARENVAHEEPPAGPSQVFNNSMWGRFMSKKSSVKLHTIESAVGRKTREPEDTSPAAEPFQEGSEPDSDDQEDIHDGTRVGPEEESQNPKETHVFVNNLFTRMQSGLQRSFQSFRSFGDRSGSSGVKLKSIASFAKGMRKKEAGSAAIREDAVEEGSPPPFTLPETPTREEPQNEMNVTIPGAEHLSDSSDDEEASPFESNAVQTSAAMRISDNVQ